MRSVPTRTFLFATAVAFAALALPLHGQQAPKQQPQKGQPQATFRVHVEYVEVDAVVRDKQGNFVADLKKDEFEVLEDGKPQQVANLDVVNVPVEPRPTVAMIAGRRFEQDVYSNKEEPGRLYLIVIDDLHVQSAHTMGARRIAREFIEKNLAPNDMAAVVSTSGNRKMTQDFTTNKRLLLDAVDKVVGRKVVSPAQAALTYMGSPDDGAANTADPQRMYNSRSMLETLAQLATFAGTIHNRRKTIVMIGEGPDIDLAASEITPLFSPMAKESTPDVGPVDNSAKPGKSMPMSRTELRDKLRDFFAAASRANVTLYAFDPTIYTQGDSLVDVASGVPGDYEAATGIEIVKSGRIYDDIMAAQDNLRTMANGTGGFAVTGGRDLAKQFDRIRTDNSHYYILGYYPANEKRDGKYRKIEVRLKRTGLTVDARKGYNAPKGDKADAPVVETKEGTSAPLREALLSALPTAGLPIAVTAAPFRGTQGNASVLLMMQTPPGAVKFEEKLGKYEGNLEVSFVAVNDIGKTVTGEHIDLAMPLKPGTYAAVTRVGLLVQSRVSLPPGRYVLRVGARDVLNGKVGAVHCDLEVPDFAKLPLAMSGLIVSSADTALANPRPDSVLAGLVKVLPGSPVVTREFVEGDQLGLLTEIYDTKLATPHDIDIVTTILAEDGREAYRHDEKRSTAELQGMDSGFGYALKVPLTGLPPGTYVLRVEARSRLDVDNPVARETMVRILAQ
jgi:VWFA-related protein